MPIEQVPLTGAVNLDDPPQVVANGMLRRDTRNVSWYGPSGNKRPQSLPGTINLFSAYGFSLPAGDNLCIGRKYDPVKYRMFWFNQNSNGNDGIYILNTRQGTIQALIQNGVDTTGEVLGFIPTVTISSVDIIYGDPVDGDILVYTDSQKRITRIPINIYLAATYSPIKRNYIDLAKQPPPEPIHCVYENANDLENNNLRNALFKVRCRQVFDVLDKCVYSTISECPLPYNAGDMAINQDPTKNGRIAMYLPTGDADVKKIEVWIQQVKDGVTSDWLLVESLDKAALSIPNNDLWRYLFYNDSTYPSADPGLVVQDQTYIPQQNNCSALFNGNVVAVADTIENYDQIQSPEMTAEVNAVEDDLTSLNGFLFFAYQNPDTDLVTIYLTGTGTNDVNDNPTTINTLAGALLKVMAQDAAQAEVGFSVNASDVNIATALTQLQVASIAQGWTFVSLGTNTLVISSPATTLNSTYYTPVVIDNKPNAIFTSLPNCNIGYAINYRDDKGRTNTVVTTPQLFIKTPSQFFGAYPLGLVQVELSISHRPPIWATGYQVLRTPELTYSKLLNWVSRQAYSQTVNSQHYAYIDVGNIIDYNKAIQGSEGVVQYNFAPGDRARFNARWDIDSAGHDLSTFDLDYEVLSLEVNPLINGIVQQGNFVKFYYPTADISAGFAFDGDDNFQNYQVLLYNIKPHQSGIVVGQVNNNTYFEFGKWFKIGNPGTTAAYHMGNFQTQTANLSQPAIILINDGDNFFRWRNVPVGNIYYVQTGSHDQITLYGTIDFGLPATVTNSAYVLQASTSRGWDVPGSDPNYADADYNFWNKSTGTLTVNVKGSMSVLDHQNPGGYFAYTAVVISPTDVQTVTYIIPQRNSLEQNVQYSYPYDFDIAVPANYRLWFVTITRDHTFVGGELMQVSVKRNLLITVIEPSFSDVYAIVTSSNGKPAVIDTDAKQQEYPTRLRFSHPDQQGTNVNGISIMYPFDYDEFDRSKGKVMRIIARQRNARIFHERGAGVVGIYAKFISNAGGSTSLIVTDEIITPNNIQYYDGDFGLANQPDGLFSDGLVDYFTDPVKGYIIRLSQDGNTSLSEEAKVQSFVGPLGTQYLSNHDGYYGGYAKIIAGCFYHPDKKKECIIVFQSGADLQGDTIIWDEAENAFTGWRDWQPDMIECGENILYMWQKGVLYSLTNQNQHNTFFSPYGQIYQPGQVAQYGVIEQYGVITQYGILYPAMIDLIFNPQANAKKEYRAINYNSQYGKIWTSPLPTQIETELGQQSTLLEEDYDFREGVYSAAFWRDVNSEGGLIEGDFLKGVYMEMVLQRLDPDLIYIFGLYLNYAFSPRNG